MNKNESKIIKTAVALKYSSEENSAPEVIAAGMGEIADKILLTAGEYNVPVYQDDRLAQALSILNIGDEIPAELYEVVAEVLVFVSGLDRDYGEANGNGRQK